MHLSDLGEFGLIRRLTSHLGSRPDVVLAAGDDAAILALGAGYQIVATVDAQVEGKHFLRAVSSPQEIGHKALAVNVSDIAAMGATPAWALVSLLLPETLDVTVLDGIYAGMRALASQFALAIVGGNVAATDGPLALDITLLGLVEAGRAVSRSGGRPGDALVVTGTLGAAAAGVLAFVTERDHAQVAPDALAEVRRAMVAPTPRVAEGRALAATGALTAMLDISDGLAADLAHLCEASGVGAVIEVERVPVSLAARQVCAAYERDPLALALNGGEDYELLCGVRPESVDAALQAVASAGGTARVIGHLTGADEGITLKLANGKHMPMEIHGWDHLRRSAPDASRAISRGAVT